MRLCVILLFACSSNHGLTPDAGDAGGDAIDGATGSASLAVLRQFDGASGPGYKDHPDLGGAVGPSSVVDMVGSDFIVRDKTSGAVTQQMTQDAFWTAAGVTPTTLNDPRLVFDPLVSRWYAVTAGPNAFLAVSADADPTHAWKGVTLTNLVSGDLLARVGFDANGVYVCLYGGNVDAICTAIPKADVMWTGNGSPSLAHEAVFTGLPFEIFPAVDLDPAKPSNAPEVLLTRQGTQTGGIPMVLVMVKVTWSGTTASASVPQNISTGLMYNTPGSAAQPAQPPIRGVEDHRFMGVFAHGGSIFAVMGSQIAGRLGAEWFEVRVSDGTLLQVGSLADPTYDVLFPTLAVDTHGNVMIAFTQTSATETPAVAVAYRLAGDPQSTLRAPIVTTPGTTSYACSINPVGWGTYSSTMTDPAAPDHVWTYQEYAASSTACAWTTRWVELAIQ